MNIPLFSEIAISSKEYLVSTDKDSFTYQKIVPNLGSTGILIRRMTMKLCDRKTITQIPEQVNLIFPNSVKEIKSNKAFYDFLEKIVMENQLSGQKQREAKQLELFKMALVKCLRTMKCISS